MDEFENKNIESEENSGSESAPSFEAETPLDEKPENQNDVSQNEPFDPFAVSSSDAPFESQHQFGNCGYDIYGRPYNSQSGTFNQPNPNNYYEPRPPKSKNTGLKVFIIILSAVLATVLTFCVISLTSKNLNKEKTSNNGERKNNSAPNVELYERPESDDELSANYTEAFNLARESVVDILVYSPDDDSMSGSASGVIYSEDGYIVTNDHIYESVPNAKFLVKLSNGTEHRASFVAGDVRSDLAVLKFDEKVDGLIPAEFGDSESCIVGEPVITVGYPFTYGESATLTHGILSAVDRRVTSSTTNYASTFLQTDATINPGNSGGALCNMYGQVIGITSSKLAGDEYDAVSFAIPTTTMKRVVNGLIKNGCVADRAKLGITYNEIDFLTADSLNLPRGVMIQSVSEDSELYTYGITKGDIITHVNGIEILSSNTLLDVIEASKAGDKVELTIYKASKGTEDTVSVTMLSDKGVSSYTTEKAESNYINPFGF